MQQEHTIDCVFFKSIDTSPVSPSFLFASFLFFFKNDFVCLCLFQEICSYS